MLWLQKNPWPWWLQLQLCFIGCILSHSTKRLLLWIGELLLSWYGPSVLWCSPFRFLASWIGHLVASRAIWHWKEAYCWQEANFWCFGGAWCHRGPLGTRKKGTLWKRTCAYFRALIPPMIFISLLERDKKSWLGSAGMETGAQIA